MQALFRPVILRIADNPAVNEFFHSNSATRALVDRFVAGESLDVAIDKALAIARHGMRTTLDLLGENVVSDGEARLAVDEYVSMLRRMDSDGLEPNISVKLTMLGLDLSDALARDGMRSILSAARELSGFVRVDMEGSVYTERTVAIVDGLHDEFPDNVGTVLQSYLYRTDRDLTWALEKGIRIRLVKGAYAEPATVAYQKPDQVDEAFVRQMERLLDGGNFPAIATHDAAIIRSAQGYVLRMGIGKDRFEFQMLFGVRKDLQQSLVEDGYGMRVYVPFGSRWYPYFTRRIAERPANALFVVRQFLG